MPSALFAPQVLVLVSKLPYHESFQRLLREFVLHHLPSWVQAGSSGIPVEHLQELYRAAACPVQIELPAPWRQRKVSLTAAAAAAALEPSSSKETQSESSTCKPSSPASTPSDAMPPAPASPSSALPPVPESPASMSSPESSASEKMASSNNSSGTTTKERGAVALYFEEDFRGNPAQSPTKSSSGRSSGPASGRQARRLMRPPPGSVRHIALCGKQFLLPSRNAAEWEDEFGARCLEADMTPLFTHLQPSNVIRLFSSVLLERSVLVVANDSGPLFHTLESLRALAFPLTWYHIYLPVLPEAFEGMTGQLQAPVTYLMGCAKGVAELMENIKFENCVVADLDDDVVRERWVSKKSFCKRSCFEGVESELLIVHENDRIFTFCLCCHAAGLGCSGLHEAPPRALCSGYQSCRASRERGGQTRESAR